mmetsp:Transcript_26168/g.39608  ORF Transcript_26168/g.39608 Transcript_26168/m.39608 type:complete len:268 (+) Transcript_26168:1291-2094(+)
MAIAVSFASPVIIMIRMPASVHFLILSATSGRAGSFIPTMPAKVKPLSRSLYLEGSLSKGCFTRGVFSVGSKFLRLGSRLEVSFTASARQRRGRVASSETFLLILRLSSPVRRTTLPSRHITSVHLSISKFGAPFTYNLFPDLLGTLHSTDIDFRSRLNSKVAIREYVDLHTSTFAFASTLGGTPRVSSSNSSAIPPTFSANTHKAASVGSPTLSYFFSSVSESCPKILASLHKAETAAISATAPVGNFLNSSPEIMPSIMPIGAYE